MAENSELPATAKTERGIKLMRRWQSMSSELALWKAQWQDIADYMMPRSAGINTKFESPNTNRETVLFDTTAGDAAMTMAGGLMSWTSPANEAWFSYKPNFDLRGVDPVERWLTECTDIIRELLANSNFYTETHEDLLTHCTFATSAMFIGMKLKTCVPEEIRKEYNITRVFTPEEDEALLQRYDQIVIEQVKLAREAKK